MVDADAMTVALPGLGSAASPPGGIAAFARWRPWLNLSSVLMWVLGTATAAYASWASCADARGRRDKARRGGGGDDDDDDEGRDAASAPALELTLSHAGGFIVVASGMLLLLFFVDLYLAVTLLFCLSAMSSTAAVVFAPLLSRLLGRWRAERVLCDTGEALLGPVSLAEGLSHGCGLALALTWFALRHTWALAFALQDLFGCCLCVLFLGAIRLPSLRVATALLTLAFAYDVFFVFLSPLVFHESVMVKVATGNAPDEDPSYCEKYPTDYKGCATNELPMLLLLPRLFDFEGGITMLGLGDIVLPGLLLSFAARYDALVTTRTSNAAADINDGGGGGNWHGKLPPPRSSSVFGSALGARWPRHWALLVGGYAVGLAMANVAVAVTGMGQPALLYLVPCTLGPLVWTGRRDGTLAAMWEGPPEMADPDYDELFGSATTGGGGGEGGTGGVGAHGGLRVNPLQPEGASEGGARETEGEPLLVAMV